MKANAYRLSSAHRLAGGRERLAFVFERAEATALARKRPLRIVLAGWEQGLFALPLAEAGHEVTVLEERDALRTEATQQARECGVSLSVCTEATLSRIETPFDAIVVDTTGSDEAYASLAVLRPYLRAGGVAWIAGARREAETTFATFRSRLLVSGWRTTDAVRTVARRRSLMGRLSQQSGWDRLSERVMRMARPLVTQSAAWIVEAVFCDATRPYVVHLMPSFGVGGTEQVVLSLATGLLNDAHGCDVSVVSLFEGGALQGVFQERGIRTRVLTRRDPFGISTVIDLVRLFRIERPDIVHTHLFGADAWGRLAAFFARVPVVISTEHNVNPSYRIVHRFVNRLFSRWTDAVVAVSESVKRVSLEQDGVPAQKLRVIPNGIEIDRIALRGGHGFHDVPRLITVGRLYPQKDHATLLKALALVRRPWKLSVVGDGPLRTSLRALAEQLGIASRVCWLGTRHDVPELLASSDVFCFPSRWEGLGNAALEAAAAAVPTILSDLPPLREAFRTDDTRFVAAGDVPGWARAIESVLAHPAEAVTRALRAAPALRANVSSDRMVAMYLELYHSLLRAYV
jgi:glycosyltransferase involved in cell wall biosynthesis